MITIPKLVISTIDELSPAGNFFPQPIYVVFSAVNFVHRCWSWIRKIYTYSQNCLKIAVGYGVNLQFGDSLFLKISALFVLVTTRIMDCVKQQEKLQKTWEKWLNAVSGHYIQPTKVEWKDKAENSFISESTRSWWVYHGERIANRAQLVALRTFQLVKHTFFLSMKIVDAISDASEAFSMSQNVVNDGINEIFMNGAKWANMLVEDKKLLLEGLQANRKIIEILVAKMDSSITADQMINAATNAVNVVSGVFSSANSATATTEGFLFDCAKKWTHEFMTSIGLDHFLTQDMLPPPQPRWMMVSREIHRYPKKEKVTKPLLSITAPLPSPMKRKMQE